MNVLALEGATMRLLLAVVAMLPVTVSGAFADSDPNADFHKADKALNETFRQIEKRLADDTSGKARLIAAQKAWIAFRDAECTFQSSGEDGGTAAPMVATSCRATLTEDRTRQLKAYLHCQEGDLACPVPAQ
ncbi:MAG: lysozyme inhibitor LprI family protein [Mesorhizobium sp.]